MSARTSIVKALAEKLKAIDGTGQYKTSINGNAYPKLKFWDEVQDLPAVYLAAGSETREYKPGAFKWAFLSISIKCYVKEEDPQAALENLLEDVERCLDANRNLVYDETVPGAQLLEISITSIITDEGLLEPYGVGEINITVQHYVI
jgi:hypothetical protein